MAIATTDRLPMRLWRAINLICRGVTGAGARPAATFVQYGHIAPAEIVELREAGLLQVTADGDSVTFAGMAEHEVRRLLVLPATRIRATAAGNRWVGENPYNRVLRVVRQRGRSFGATVRDVCAAADVDVETVRFLAGEGLLHIRTAEGHDVPPRRLLERGHLFCRLLLTSTAADIVGA